MTTIANKKQPSFLSLFLEGASFFFVLLSFGVMILAYNAAPERLIVHWNASGVANGFGSKLTGLVLLPVMIALMYALFLLIPRIEPLGENLEKFKMQYAGLKLVFTAFMCALYIMTVLVNLGVGTISIPAFMLVAMSVLFYYLGWMMKYCKRNYFVGIRTPWTLSSDSVWDKTHKLGSAVFKALAVIFLIACLALPPRLAFVTVILLILSAAFLLTVYSYIAWSSEKNESEKKKRA